MSLEIWLLFVATETLLCFSPGPAVLTVVSQAISRGSRAGLWTAAGVLLANALYFVISASGLFAVLVAWHELFVWIKWLGAAYLIWLGVGMWRTQVRKPAGGSAKESGLASSTAHATEYWRAGRRGFTVQAANPKTLLFFLALLPQFIDPTHAINLQFAILGTTSIAIEFCVLALYTGLASGAADWTRGSAREARFTKWLDRAGGSLLIAAGAGLAAIRRTG